MADEMGSGPKLIAQIQVGVIEDKVGWVLQYQDGRQESFALHLPIARQFLGALEECVEALTQQADQGSGTHDGMGMREQVAVRLGPPAP